MVTSRPRSSPDRITPQPSNSHTKSNLPASILSTAGTLPTSTNSTVLASPPSQVTKVLTRWVSRAPPQPPYNFPSKSRGLVTPDELSNIRLESLCGSTAAIDKAVIPALRAGSKYSEYEKPKCAVPAPTAASTPTSAGSIIVRLIPSSSNQPLCFARYMPA